MKVIEELFTNNHQWAELNRKMDSNYFVQMTKGQQPKYLWIGCSDSRVPPNAIVGLGPGDLFVHRNIANVVSPKDINLMAILQYSVENLKVKHVVVCGHYGCGGVQASFGRLKESPLNDWIDHIRLVHKKYEDELNRTSDEESRWRRLCELNVKAQVESLSNTDTVQEAWKRDQELMIHGLIYDLNDGLLHNLDLTRGS